VLHTMLIVLEQSFLYMPLVFGAYISISLMKMPDLSIESAYVFGAIVAVRCLEKMQWLPFSLHLPVALCLALLGGMVVGLISSCLTQFARIPHLLSSVLTIGLFHGINQFILGTSSFSLSSFINPLAVGFWAKNPELPILASVGFGLIILGCLFLHTQLGYSFAVFGNNSQFFENYKISTAFICCSGITLANALAGISGYFVAQSSGFVDVNAGLGMALFCVTSLILGKALYFFRKPFSLTIPIIGTLSYFSIAQFLLKIGFNQKYFTMIQAAIVLFILINRFRKMKQHRMSIDNLGV
jgi:putative tryptophan/tyrosine transport system permease protein